MREDTLESACSMERQNKISERFGEAQTSWALTSYLPLGNGIPASARTP